MARDLLVNLVAATIAFCAGVLARSLGKQRRRRRPAARVWQLNSHLPTSIVTGEGPLIDILEYKTPAVWPTAYAAATEISLYLAQTLGVRVDRVCTSNNFPRDKALEGNLIVIGGPVRNSLYRELWDRIDHSYGFVGYDLVRLSDQHRYSATIDEGRVKQDVGLAIMTQNPFNEKARLVILAGCRVYGTLAAARAVVDPLVLETAKIMRHEAGVSLVVRGDVVGEYLASTSIVEYQINAIRSLNS